MVAANGATARFLEERAFPLRRVVREPARWARIVAVAAEYGEALPAEPDSRALALFLAKRRTADPLRFPDLSLVIVKLMGAGEYAVERPGEDAPGHFGLAVKDYTHSTAPNRRYPDLLTQRLLKAAVAGSPSPYTAAALDELAALHGEGERRKQGRAAPSQVGGGAPPLHADRRPLQQRRSHQWRRGQGHLGTHLQATRRREGGRGLPAGLDVGRRVRVELIRADERGFIDFKRVSDADRG